MWRPGTATVSVPGRPSRTYVVTVRPGRLRVSRDGLSVLRRVGASRDSSGVPGQFGRRSGRVKSDECPGTARSVLGRVGRPGTPKYPSGVALIRAPGFAVRNGLKHVPGRSGRPGTVAGVPGRLERPGTAGKASRDGCCVLRRWRASWDGANVLGRQAVSQDGENVLGRCVGRPGTARCSVLGRRRASWDRDARTVGRFRHSGFTTRFTRFTRFTTH